MSSTVSGILSQYFPLAAAQVPARRGPDGDPLSSSPAPASLPQQDSVTISDRARRLLAAEGKRTEQPPKALRPDGEGVTRKPDADGVASRPDGDGVVGQRDHGGLLGLPDHEHAGDNCGLCRSAVEALASSGAAS